MMFQISHEESRGANSGLTNRAAALLYIVVLPLLLAACARPEPGSVIDNKGEICFRTDEAGHMRASISPEGCYSTNCTRQVQKVGSVVLDRRNFEIRFDAHFTLAEEKSFLIPCIDNCLGGGTIDFDLGILDVGLYSVWLGDRTIGELSVTSGLPPRDQCLP